ncbi:MAG: phosphonoacetaldehyde reductase [Lachnospiraceae bacterium]|nr:phosphonoacetaldehyde reductase [Lachnospiraceae bacterium]
MVEQKVLVADNDYVELDNYIQENGFKTVFLVCDDSLRFLRIKEYFDKVEKRLNIRLVYFSDFTPNPLYESVVKGVKLFNDEGCDAIFAVGGGSTMDVAKCIKLYSNMDHNVNYLKQDIIPNDIPLFAIPTTAGTGSEATRYAVIYYEGEKQSVADYSCIPSTVMMDATVLKTLPEYQKKVTMLDALCHAIESYWSVNSTEESKVYSREAIQLIMANKDSYLANQDEGNANMLKAANVAGKAINITQTTAGHAMCYKLTSLYGIAHGHAAALCLSKLWPYMVDNTDKCIDTRGKDYVQGIFRDIANAFGCNDAKDAVALFDDLLKELGFNNPKADEKDYEILSSSVNPVRLKNNPIGLDYESINSLYRQIV